MLPHLLKTTSAATLLLALTASAAPDLFLPKPPNGAGPGDLLPQPDAQHLRVGVARFRALRADAATLWIGEGIQSGIVADLAKSKAVDLRDLAEDATELDAVIAAGRASGAEVVVLGTFQSSADEVRASGRIVVVSTRRVLAYLSARSGLKDVFRLQDDLAAQVRAALVKEPATPQPPPGNNPPPAPPVTPPSPGTPDAPPVPYSGSALERSLEEERRGRPPDDQGQEPPRERRHNNPPPDDNGGSAGGPSRERPYGYGGGGSYFGGYGYPWYYYNPPSSPPPGGNGGGTPPPSGGSPPPGGSGGGSGGASPPPAPPPASPPPQSPPRGLVPTVPRPSLYPPK